MAANESQAEKQTAVEATPETMFWEVVDDIPYVGLRSAHKLRDAGIETVDDVLKSPITELTMISGLGEKRAKQIKVRLGDFTVIDDIGIETLRALWHHGITGENIDQYEAWELASIDNVNEDTAKRLHYYATADIVDVEHSMA